MDVKLVISRGDMAESKGREGERGEHRGGEVSAWLRLLGLGQYAHDFHEQGYDDMEVCAAIGDADMDSLGVLAPTHRTRLHLAVALLCAPPLSPPLYHTLEPTEDMWSGEHLINLQRVGKKVDWRTLLQGESPLTGVAGEGHKRSDLFDNCKGEQQQQVRNWGKERRTGRVVRELVKVEEGRKFLQLDDLPSPPTSHSRLHMPSHLDQTSPFFKRSLSVSVTKHRREDGCRTDDFASAATLEFDRSSRSDRQKGSVAVEREKIVQLAGRYGLVRPQPPPPGTPPRWRKEMTPGGEFSGTTQRELGLTRSNSFNGFDWTLRGGELVERVPRGRAQRAELRKTRERRREVEGEGGAGEMGKTKGRSLDSVLDWKAQSHFRSERAMRPTTASVEGSQDSLVSSYSSSSDRTDYVTWLGMGGAAATRRVGVRRGSGPVGERKVITPDMPPPAWPQPSRGMERSATDTELFKKNLNDSGTF
uniref:SAM domain-containing protein n=1 Tax=Eptatretus burgeri TaxID=7764 RepID=A0A8C4QDM1_EPTBU